MSNYELFEVFIIVFIIERRAIILPGVCTLVIPVSSMLYTCFALNFFFLQFSFKYTVSRKNVPPLACYNFEAHELILIFFGRNVTDKVGNQKTLYYATSNNLCFCTTCQNGETRKSHFSLNWIVLHTQCTCVLSS